MSFLSSMKAERLIADIKASGDPTSPNARKALARLAAMGSGAIEPILEALSSADKKETLAYVEVLTSLVEGRRPRVPVHSVCLDCKRRGNVCVTVARGVPCLGPITHTGCGALCPTYDRGCYGCYGPCAEANPESLTADFVRSGAAAGRLVPLLRNFNAAAPDFRRTSDRLEVVAERGAP